MSSKRRCYYEEKITICIFLALIVITSVVFMKGAIDSYNYDMEPANGVDRLNGLGAVLTIMVGVFYTNQNHRPGGFHKTLTLE